MKGRKSEKTIFGNRLNEAKTKNIPEMQKKIFLFKRKPLIVKKLVRIRKNQETSSLPKTNNENLVEKTTPQKIPKSKSSLFSVKSFKIEKIIPITKYKKISVRIFKPNIPNFGKKTSHEAPIKSLRMEMLFVSPKFKL
jgi:hypothetical protein